jgi:lysophospholipid acyltransferase (LPLAT)-like uncharacterized protein
MREKGSFKKKIALFAAQYVLPYFILLIGKTWRIDRSGAFTLPSNAVVCAIWHSQLLSLSYIFRNLGVKVLISRSFDGEIIARAIKKLGFDAIRGSSTKGGAQALLQIIESIETGSVIAITTDGPKGPSKIVKDGIAKAAIETGAPVICVITLPKNTLRLGSWDSFEIPLPFSKITLRMHEPITFDKTDSIAGARNCIQSAIDSLETNS